MGGKYTRWESRTRLRIALRAARYERNMLADARSLLRRIQRPCFHAQPLSQDDIDAITVYNSLVTQVGISARNLLEFFFHHEHRKYVRASQLVQDRQDWERDRGELTPVLRDALAMASSLATHISHERIDRMAKDDERRARNVEAPIEGGKNWDTDSITDEIERLWRVFLAHVRPEIASATPASER